MKAQDQYLKFVRWEEADGLYVGYCPDLFPWGGVCHGKTEEEAYRSLCALVQQEVEELLQAGKELPPASTRPMREAVPAWQPAGQASSFAGVEGDLSGVLCSGERARSRRYTKAALESRLGGSLALPVPRMVFALTLAEI